MQRRSIQMLYKLPIQDQCDDSLPITMAISFLMATHASTGLPCRLHMVISVRESDPVCYMAFTLCRLLKLYLMARGTMRDELPLKNVHWFNQFLDIRLCDHVGFEAKISFSFQVLMSVRHSKMGRRWKLSNSS